MNRLNALFRHTLVHHLWEEFQVRYRFKYVFPKVSQTVQDGIVLDLSQMSLKVRNRILMGIYEAHEKRLCQEFLSPNDAVLEIGGAIGFIGLFCQKRLGIRHYTVVEANPNTLQILRRNYQLNGLEPNAWHLALGPADGTLDLQVGTDFWENSIFQQAAPVEASDFVRVPSVCFVVLAGACWEKSNVLIVDVEGAEQFIDLDEIPSDVDKMIMEIHPHVLGSEKTYDLIAGLVQRGFRVAREEEGTFAF